MRFKSLHILELKRRKAEARSEEVQLVHTDPSGRCTYWYRHSNTWDIEFYIPRGFRDCGIKYSSPDNFWVASIFAKDTGSKFYAWVSWHKQNHEKKQIKLKQGTVEVIKNFSVEMLPSWCNPGLWELYSNVKWQPVMAKPTSDGQLPTNLLVTRGI